MWSGNNIWRECRGSVSESSLDDPKQQTTVQTSRHAEPAFFHPTQEQVGKQQLELAGVTDICAMSSYLVKGPHTLPLPLCVFETPPENHPLRHDALRLGKDFAKETNCSVNNFVCLLSLTPQAVLAAQMKTSREPQTPNLELPTQLHKTASKAWCVYLRKMMKSFNFF